MKKAIGTATILALILMGCQGSLSSIGGGSTITAPPKEFLDIIVELNQQYIDAIGKLQLSAGKLAEIAGFEIGFLIEAMGEDIRQLKPEAGDILKKYEKLADSMKGDSGLTGKQKGSMIGMRWRFLYLAGQSLWEKYGAGILSALKLAF